MEETKSQRYNRSRRKTNISKTGESVKECYCRKCMKTLPTRYFFSAIDTFLDANGFFSVCKNCIHEIFENIYAVEKSLEITVLRMCRMFNMKYSQAAIDATLAQLETMKAKGNTDTPFFGIYRMKLVTTAGAKNNADADLTYSEITQIVTNEQNNLREINPEMVDHDVSEFWGDDYTVEEYKWLERTLANYMKTHKSDTQSELSLLREIVFIEFEIKQARKEKKSTATLVKNLQEIMKTAAIDPSKANAASSGKSQETFGAIVKMIEETEPADFYQDQELFKDYDNIRDYFIKYIVRPMKNFITSSRDFNINVEEDDDEADMNEPLEVPVDEEGRLLSEATSEEEKVDNDGDS